MNYDLMDCPFCGGKAEIRQKGTTKQSMIIGCTDCHCELESGDVFGLTVNLAWNRRAYTPWDTPQIKPKKP